MKKLVIQEQHGHFHLGSFGPYYCGTDGRSQFTLVIQGNEGLYLEFPDVTVHDLFSRFDLRDHEFREGRFVFMDLVRVRQDDRECVIEARCGTLYDFFKERAASGNCCLSSSRPLAFFWSGRGEGTEAA
jgi:hypothetical protein